MTRAASSRSRIPVEYHDTGSDLDAHVKLIKKQLDKSMRDAEVRQLAVKITSGSFDVAKDPRTGEQVSVVTAWGKKFRAPKTGHRIKARNEWAEVIAIWDFVVLNCRYVYDPTDTDTFTTVEHTLDAGGLDCDDATILFAALLKSIGFHMGARVIATSKDPDTWVHIYPLVGLPKDDPSKWVALDMTVLGATPGWEYRDISKHKDYRL